MYMHRAWGKTRAETWAWKPNMAVGVAAALATGGQSGVGEKWAMGGKELWEPTEEALMWGWWERPTLMPS